MVLNPRCRCSKKFPEALFDSIPTIGIRMQIIIINIVSNCLTHTNFTMFIDQILLKSPLKWLLCLLFLSISNVESGENEFGSRRLLQLVEYIGVDYPEAVANGEIINADEFLEMQQFSNLLLNQN